MTTLIDIKTGTAFVKFHGRLDGEAVAAMRGELAASAVLAAPLAVVLDLTDVTLLDGAGVGVIAHLFRNLTGSGRSLRVTGASGQPLAYLRDLGLGSVLGLPQSRRNLRVRFFKEASAA